jgi:hypothetical protein
MSKFTIVTFKDGKLLLYGVFHSYEEANTFGENNILKIKWQILEIKPATLL